MEEGRKEGWNERMTNRMADENELRRTERSKAAREGEH